MGHYFHLYTLAPDHLYQFGETTLKLMLMGRYFLLEIRCILGRKDK